MHKISKILLSVTVSSAVNRHAWILLWRTCKGIRNGGDKQKNYEITVIQCSQSEQTKSQMPKVVGNQRLLIKLHGIYSKDGLVTLRTTSWNVNWPALIHGPCTTDWTRVHCTLVIWFHALGPSAYEPRWPLELEGLKSTLLFSDDLTTVAALYSLAADSSNTGMWRKQSEVDSMKSTCHPHRDRAFHDSECLPARLQAGLDSHWTLCVNEKVTVRQNACWTRTWCWMIEKNWKTVDPEDLHLMYQTMETGYRKHYLNHQQCN